jgi:hypothetical protein
MVFHTDWWTPSAIFVTPTVACVASFATPRMSEARMWWRGFFDTVLSTVGG